MIMVFCKSEKRLKIYFISIKMENLKVKDLKSLAKDKSIKGYYRLRKAELIEVLTPVGDLPLPQKIMDQPIPEIVYDLININSPPTTLATKKKH